MTLIQSTRFVTRRRHGVLRRWCCELWASGKRQKHSWGGGKWDGTTRARRACAAYSRTGRGRGPAAAGRGSCCVREEMRKYRAAGKAAVRVSTMREVEASPAASGLAQLAGQEPRSDSAIQVESLQPWFIGVQFTEISLSEYIKMLPTPWTTAFTTSSTLSSTSQGMA